MNDTSTRYGWVTRTLHWSIAVLVLLQFGKFADRIDEGENWLSELVGPWHVSLGVLLLVLAAVRIVWAYVQKTRPAPVPGPLARFVKPGHWLLYAITALLPILGILAMFGGGHGLEVFGVAVFPEGDEVGWAGAFGSLHSPLAWLFLSLVLGHAGAALYHGFVTRDGSFERMAGRPPASGTAEESARLRG